ncbi:MAG: DUF3857 domain-containing protein [Rubrivivax sp.]|nr:MAG: DUF3857 domain-containing protein [Rubrivivax sp.]
MKFNPLQTLMTMAFGLTLAASSMADAPAPSALEQPATRVIRYTADYTVNLNGTSREEHEVALAVQRADAVAPASKSTVSYTPGAQQVEVIEAYTRKPDGRQVPVPKAGLIDAPDGASGRQALTVSFPDVAVGDAVVMRYRLTTIKPMFPGHFSLHESFPKTVAYDEVKIRIDAPAALWAQHQARDLRQVQSLEKDGRQIKEWAWDNKLPTPPQPERHTGYEHEQDAGLAFSTFRDHAALARAYGEQVRPKAQPSKQVTALAQTIVKEAKARSPREMARALYDWVNLNIGDAGECLTGGSVVPHDLDQVLARREGDCKDHATLLQALLAAQGIHSTQALLNTGNYYGLNPLPLPSGVNHVINHIPSLAVFADPMADSVPFGMLPFADEGKPVLLAEGYQAGLKTPVAPVGFNRQHMLTDVAIQPDGSAQGSVKVDLRGAFAVNARLRVRKLSKAQDDALVKGFFESAGQVGSGTLVKDDPLALRDTYGYQARFNAKHWLKLPGPGAFTIAPLFYSESPIADYLAAATQPVNESTETACFSGLSIEEYRYRLPAGLRITQLPKDVKLDGGTLSYSATYRLKGRLLTVKRVFDDRTVGNLCSPAMAKAYQQFAAKAVPDATAQVVFK